jgi:hypothetical protein
MEDNTCKLIESCWNTDASERLTMERIMMTMASFIFVIANPYQLLLMAESR